MKNKVFICGNYGSGGSTSSGQVIKTRIVTEEIVKQLGKENCTIYNTYKRIKSLLSICFVKIPLLYRYEHVIIFPAHNGVALLVPVFAIAKILYGLNIHYVVIGGWLPSFIKHYPLTKWALKKYDGIYVETTTMLVALREQGYSNVFVMPNCKPLKILKEEELTCQFDEPYKLVTFSRVMKEKGIEDLIHIISDINKEKGKKVYALDIYGHIQQGEEEWFNGVMESIKDDSVINYMGEVSYNDSTSVLSRYFALVFPTRFYTEGVPGTIIDAYSAGLPVISARWESFNDVVEDGVTGIGFEFENWAELKHLLLEIAFRPQILIDKKKACLKKASEFLPSVTISLLVDKIHGV